jgi:DNA-binding MarR family transcriptional regulator
MATIVKHAPRESPGPAPPQPLTTNLCWLLSTANHNLATRLTAALEGLGVSMRAHQVLAAAAAGTYTQIELARAVGLDKTTMVVTLDELEAAGLAERQTSSTDRRVRVISVTRAGRRKLREAEEIVARIQQELLGVLSAEQRTTFLDALALLATDRLSAPVECVVPVRRRAPRASA